MVKRLKIGVSACLIGLKYRYDGESKINRELIRRLGDKVDFIPVCPEVECGLTVPRPKMRLEVSSKGTRIKEIESGVDHTDEFCKWMEIKLEQLNEKDIAAFLFRAKSPSCGLGTCKLFSPTGRCIRENGSGLFASMLTKRFAHMIVDDDQHLAEFIHKIGLDDDTP